MAWAFEKESAYVEGLISRRPAVSAPLRVLRSYAKAQEALGELYASIGECQQKGKVKAEIKMKAETGVKQEPQDSSDSEDEEPPAAPATKKKGAPQAKTKGAAQQTAVPIPQSPRLPQRRAGRPQSPSPGNHDAVCCAAPLGRSGIVAARGRALQGGAGCRMEAQGQNMRLKRMF